MSLWQARNSQRTGSVFIVRRQPGEKMNAKKEHLLFPIALLLVAAAWATGCANQPISGTPHHTATTTQVASEKSSAIRETLDARTAVPTATLQEEEARLTPTPAPSAAQVELPVELDGVVHLAKEDLAQRLGLDGDSIWLVSAEAVEWPDASLGCPTPDMMYAQVITPGFKVVLQAEGLVYEYHTDQQRVVVLCESTGVAGEIPSKEADTTVEDGWPSQPIEGGHVERRTITPMAPE
jgi:hypothetical protein